MSPEPQKTRAEIDAHNAEQVALRAKFISDERERRVVDNSPVAQAAAAKEAGQGFFEIQLEVGSSQRDSTIFGGNNDTSGMTRTTSHSGTLAAIEEVGWKLEHVGHVFMVTSESSRNKLLATGQQVAVSGKTIGIYLFRNAD